jgi:hypothetical protein
MGGKNTQETPLLNLCLASLFRTQLLPLTAVVPLSTEETVL